MSEGGRRPAQYKNSDTREDDGTIFLATCVRSIVFEDRTPRHMSQIQ